ncbi:MAG: sialidase family protein, partial [Planctomycetota bacterium]
MNSKTLLLLAFISGSHVSQVFSAEGKLSSFQGEAKFAIEGIYGKGRQPNVVVAMDGTVLATFVSGEALQVRRSEDGGKTWGVPIILGKYKHIFSGGGVTVDESSGGIFVFAEKYRWPANPPPPTVYQSG